VSRIRVAACQIDSVLGDLEGNVQRIVRALAAAEEKGCALAVTPELAVTGYPPEDLVFKHRFVDDNLAALDRLVKATADFDCALVVGFVSREGSDLYNAAAVIHRGSLLGTYAKQLLPNYAVFDEKRYFSPGAQEQQHFCLGGIQVAVLICEDLWFPEPAARAAGAGAELLVAPNGSPYYRGRLSERVEAMSARALESGCPLLYVNLVGGQDELVFDGASFLVGGDGRLLARAPQFEEAVMVATVDTKTGGGEGSQARLLEPVEEVYHALVVGTRDYVAKNGFEGALVAMSGGIDSSLVAAIAADALGAERVHGVAMPSRYSSRESVTDAESVANELGIGFEVIPIEKAHAAFLEMLGGSGEGLGKSPGGGRGEVSLAEENLQSRIRGVTIMYLSNLRGLVVLTTGNKSELAVGYSTLYGDTAGGFAVIKDVPKTLVYELARYRNRAAVESLGPWKAGQGKPVISDSVMTKPPSAELRPGQRDDQSLPPYEVLDPVLEAYVEGDATVPELIEAGFDADLACRVARLVDAAEYKRRQNPPGVRVTPKAFGRDRRMPITNRYGCSRQ
jgi:NAD+ synthase (glutamine-hydrolysing)